MNQKTNIKKSSRNILVAFILNLGFSIYEFIGGTLTGSTAIVSDAVHDLGDALSIGISFFLEKKSAKHPDSNYTYGYIRYSLVGGMITTLILVLGSIFVIGNAINRFINPTPINYNGMIILALIGVVVNFIAAYATHRGNSLNQRSVNLHMLEDVLGWVVVLVGAIIMRFVDITYIDPFMSICVAIFILQHALVNFRSILDVFLEKTPTGISLADIKAEIRQIEQVTNVHHVHIWSLDGYHNYATLHVVSKRPSHELKQKIKSTLRAQGIEHITIELETPDESCHDQNCHPDATMAHHHH